MFREFSSKINKKECSNSINEQCFFCLKDLLYMDRVELQDKIFELTTASMDDSKRQFVHIKCSDLETRTIIQIIDISDTILYDQQKAQVQFQEVSTACVSHEFRNPLNSIQAQNINKQYLYTEMEKMFKDTTLQIEELREKGLRILGRLNESLKIQDVSTEMMTYLVQDILDMAQINSDKFRKNISKFKV